MNLAIVDRRVHKTMRADDVFRKVLMVDENTPLHDLITAIRVDLTMFHSSLETMRIDSHARADHMQLCKEGVDPVLATLEFGRLNGLFVPHGLIVLQGCSIATRTPGHRPFSLLMFNMALACRTFVLASPDPQYPPPNNGNIDPWEGHLALCSPYGRFYSMPHPGKRVSLTFKEFRNSFGDPMPEATMGRIWAAMFPEGRSWD
jgi:hypothetical protein